MMRLALLTILGVLVPRTALAGATVTSTPAAAPPPPAAPVAEAKTPDAFYAGVGARVASHTFSNGWRAAAELQYRPRLMAHSGRDFARGGFSTRVTQRAQLGAMVAHPDGWGVRVQAQDVRIWGEEGDTFNDISAAGLDVRRAYARIPIGEALRLTLGRQELAFDNERLVGSVDWSQRGRTFDGIRGSLTLGGIATDLFYAKLVEADGDADGTVPSDRTKEADFGGAHASYVFLPGNAAAMSYLLLSDRTTDVTRHTAGGIAAGTIAAFSYSAELYLQFGTLAGQHLFAWMAAGSFGYTLPIKSKLAFVARAEALSGNGSPTRAFDTLFATNHKFYGEMDFFLAIPAHTQNRGLVDLGGQVRLAPAERLTASVDVHHLRTVEGSAPFGTELDLRVNYKPLPIVAFDVVYGVLLPDTGFEARIGAAEGARLEIEHMLFSTLSVAL
jgi:hypothetical protein